MRTADLELSKLDVRKKTHKDLQISRDQISVTWRQVTPVCAKVGFSAFIHTVTLKGMYYQ